MSTHAWCFCCFGLWLARSCSLLYALQWFSCSCGYETARAADASSAACEHRPPLQSPRSPHWCRLVCTAAEVGPARHPRSSWAHGQINKGLFGKHARVLHVPIRWRGCTRHEHAFTRNTCSQAPCAPRRGHWHTQTLKRQVHPWGLQGLPSPQTPEGPPAHAQHKQRAYEGVWMRWCKGVCGLCTALTWDLNVQRPVATVSECC